MQMHLQEPRDGHRQLLVGESGFAHLRFVYIFNLKGALDLFSLAFAVWRWPALPLLPPGAALGPPGGQGWVGPGLPGAARAPCPLPPLSS
jgi:hypothetical protein